DVHGQAGVVVADDLDLAGVHARPDLEADRADGAANRGGAPNRPGRAVERCEDAVPGAVDVTTAEAGELPGNGVVVCLQQLAPTAVAERRRPLGGADDVREEDGGKH